MNVVVIVAHPNVKSFNRAIADAAAKILRRNGHNVLFHDLYEEGFDPVLPGDEIPRDAHLQTDIERYCTEVSTAEGFVIIHPNWWGQPPAILKGWIDRVFRPGVAYEFQEGDSGEGVPIGLLRAESAIVFNTSNTPSDRELEVFGDPLETLWKNCIFALCGVKNFYRKMFGIIVTSTPEQRKEWLNHVEETVNRYFPAHAAS
ncbi:MAG TPA: NAD(P)H-dependent oxidoreductase [Syntrophales bacterium]|nr:NAD(P)H-dependent oxidoreductase [Syntrophales bacterium]